MTSLPPENVAVLVIMALLALVLPPSVHVLAWFHDASQRERLRRRARHRLDAVRAALQAPRLRRPGHISSGQRLPLRGKNGSDPSNPEAAST